MKTNELIEELSRDLVPVKPMGFSVYVTVYLTALALVAIGASSVTFRGDLSRAWASGILLLTGVPLLLSAVITMRSLALLIVPGRNEFRLWTSAAFGLFFLVIAILLSHALSKENFQELIWGGLGCAINVFLFTLAPAALWFVSLRRGAPTRPMLSGMLVGFGSSCLAAVASQLCCPNDHSWHLLGWHFVLPIVLTTLLGAVVGKYALRW